MIEIKKEEKRYFFKYQVGRSLGIKIVKKMASNSISFEKLLKKLLKAPPYIFQPKLILAEYKKGQKKHFSLFC